MVRSYYTPTMPQKQHRARRKKWRFQALSARHAKGLLQAGTILCAGWLEVLGLSWYNALDGGKTAFSLHAQTTIYWSCL